MDNFGSLQTDDQPLKLLRDVDGSALELVVDGLIPDTEYTFQVSVVESAVESLPAEASARTKVSIPPDMEAPSFHSRGNGKSTIDIELRRVRYELNLWNAKILFESNVPMNHCTIVSSKPL